MPNDKEMEELFRKRFEDFEEDPPKGSWDKIKSDLQPKRRPGRRRLVAALISLVVIGIPLAWRQYPANNPFNPKTFSHADTGPDRATARTFQQPDKLLQIPRKPIDGQGLTSPPEESKEGMEMNALEQPIQSTHRQEFLPEDDNPGPRTSKRLFPVMSNSKTNELTGDRIGSVSQVKRSTLQKEGVVTTEENDNYKGNYPVNSGNSAPTNGLEPPNKRAMPPIKPGQTPSFRLEKSLTARSLSRRRAVTTDVVFLEKNARQRQEEVLPLLMRSTNLENYFRKGNPVDLTRWVMQPSISAKSTIADDSSDTRRYPLGYTFGAYFSLRYAFSRLTPNTTDDILVKSINPRVESLRERLGYEFGIIISRRLNERWTLNGAIVFTHLNEALNFSSVSSRPDSVSWVTSGGEISLTPHHNSHNRLYKTTYNYAGMNLGVSYHYLKTGQGSLYLSGSAGLNVLVKGLTNIYENNQLSEQIRFPSPKNPLEQLNYRLSFGLGYAHTIASSTELTVEPTISYFLGSSFKQREPIGIKPYTLGVNVGLMFGKK